MRRVFALCLLSIVGGCRCSESSPKKIDLMDLVPREAALVLYLDVAGLRRAPVLDRLIQERNGADHRRNLGFDPARDLRRVVLAFAGAPGPGGQPSFLLAMEGNLRREAILEAIRRRGYRLSANRRRGRILYQDAQARGPHLLFENGGRMLAVSPGAWSELAVDRLDRRGSSILSDGSPMAGEIRGMGRRYTAWMVSRLSPSLVGYIAGRLDWEELRQLAMVRGTVNAAKTLKVSLHLELSSDSAARALADRLSRLTGSMLPSGGSSMKQRGRRLELQLALTEREVAAVLGQHELPGPLP